MACSTVLRAAAGVSSVITGSRRATFRAALSALLLAVGVSRADAQKLQFRQLTPDDGLSSSRVQAILQDLEDMVRIAGALAGLSAVDVELSFVGRTMLRVRDDGGGFDGAAGKKVNGRMRGRPGGLGLGGMRERALLIGGHLDIFTAPGAGTTIELTMGAT